MSSECPTVGRTCVESVAGYGKNLSWFPVPVVVHLASMSLMVVLFVAMTVADMRGPSHAPGSHRLPPKYGISVAPIVRTLSALSFIISLPPVALFYFYHDYDVELACTFAPQIPFLQLVVDTIILAIVITFFTVRAAAIDKFMASAPFAEVKPLTRALVFPTGRAGFAVRVAKTLGAIPRSPDDPAPLADESESDSVSDVAAGLSNWSARRLLQSDNSLPSRPRRLKIIAADAWASATTHAWAKENVRREGLDATLKVTDVPLSYRDALPYDSGSMDLVFTPFLLLKLGTAFDKDAKRLAAGATIFQEIKRVLRPGGRWILIDFTSRAVQVALHLANTVGYGSVIVSDDTFRFSYKSAKYIVCTKSLDDTSSAILRSRPRSQLYTPGSRSRLSPASPFGSLNEPASANLSTNSLPTADDDGWELFPSSAALDMAVASFFHIPLASRLAFLGAFVFDMGFFALCIVVTGAYFHELHHPRRLPYDVQYSSMIVGFCASVPLFEYIHLLDMYSRMKLHGILLATSNARDKHREEEAARKEKERVANMSKKELARYKREQKEKAARAQWEADQEAAGAGKGKKGSKASSGKGKAASAKGGRAGSAAEKKKPKFMGPSPVSLLNEYCQKKKLDKPYFKRARARPPKNAQQASSAPASATRSTGSSKGSGNGNGSGKGKGKGSRKGGDRDEGEGSGGWHRCRLILKDSGGKSRTFCTPESYPSFAEAKHYTAVMGLHALLGQTNVQRSLEPKFQKFWSSLKDEEARNEIHQQRKEQSLERRREAEIRARKLEDALPRVLLSAEAQASIESTLSSSASNAWWDADASAASSQSLAELPELPQAVERKLAKLGFGIELVTSARAAACSNDFDVLRDWLIMNVADDLLPEQYAPKRGIKVITAADKVKLAKDGTTRAGRSSGAASSTSSSRTATPAPDTDMLSAAQQYLMGGMDSFFEREPLATALASAEAAMSAAGAEAEDALPRLIDATVQAYMRNHVWSTATHQAIATAAAVAAAVSDSSDDDTDPIADEATVLESIYDTRFRALAHDRWELDLDSGTRLLVWFHPGLNYPHDLPSLLVLNSDLKPEVSTHVVRKVAAHAAELLGGPLIYDLVGWIEDEWDNLLAAASVSSLNAELGFDDGDDEVSAGASAIAAAAAASGGGGDGPGASTPLDFADLGFARPEDGEPDDEAVMHRSRRKSKRSGRSGRGTTSMWPSLARGRSKAVAAESRKIKAAMDAKAKSSSKYKTMVKFRKQLPAYKAKDEVVSAINSSSVVVISGATGCGKTTQIPQLVLDDAIQSGRGAATRIICTQPRRLAAIGVADRVAKERDSKLGTEVGYHIRLETKFSKETRLLFCTTGILLRYLQGDPRLDSVSHIMVDEVHERSVQSDFLLIILRKLLVARPDLKIVLMSATLNAELFSDYFGGVPVLSIPGRTFPVDIVYLDTVVDATGYVIKKKDRRKGSSKARPALKGTSAAEAADAAAASDSASASARNGSSTAAKIANYNDDEINYELLERLVVHIDESYGEGAILIFMPGMAEISKLVRGITERLRRASGSRRHSIHALHSSLPSAAQSAIFDRPPSGVRKIVVSTNIAETSLTIDDVVYVIDTGKVKETQYDASAMMQELVTTWVSQAGANQRAGRAGRVQPGMCFRVYSKGRFGKMLPQQVPEIQRTPLENLCLQIKSLEFMGSIRGVLADAIEPPEADAVNHAIKFLQDISALEQEDEDRITALGRLLAMLPLDVVVGKVLLYGALFSCLDPILTVAATLGERSLFFSPFEEREAASAAHAKFLRGKSDLLSVANAYSEWERIQNGSGSAAAKRFCGENYLSANGMRSVRAMKHKLARVLRDMGFGESGADLNRYAGNDRMVAAVLAGGLYPRIVKVKHPDKEYTETTSGVIVKEKYDAKAIRLFSKAEGRVFLHPSSLLFSNDRWEHPFVAYFNKVKTSRIFLRDAMMVSPYALLLFGGKIEVHHEKSHLTVDSWLRLKAPAKVSILFRSLRAELNRLLDLKIAEPHVPIDRAPIVEVIVGLFTNEPSSSV
ncbi:uncharacterized protein AMSG_12174 [Thecamonas trahens ATCC 50062]|uniref:RNA helicase n=1 Tax=Thecamonas trahens ATCC 50062 TaxID=461836 RepID=A0A0L0DJR1_THETB|nr:hypothetical protein AMSG_12174 [Thecamonas trahens ATCC 50062]KNC52644.1 hypothetical protein AMSG_12174 [Thecamonas trahens ATCC 50062]|eukprot:XP_013755250.1 hypothetical protein AMSG_12174 [Thecamonas trahens ATCC 50062]